MSRTIEPELLDALPPHHPDALHNRRDLRLTNHAMGNHRWMVRTLRQFVRPGERVLEVGAGTGDLLDRLDRAGLAADGLDRWPAPPRSPPQRRWFQADLRSFEGYAAYPVVIGNLIFHQFTDTELAAFGAAVRPTARLLVVCEPARSRWSQILYRGIAPLVGVNHVSLHDAHVSIAAGFLGDELPEALGLRSAEWKIECSLAPIGAYHLVATRRP